jgi:outer membrane protein assembly factor BamB
MNILWRLLPLALAASFQSVTLGSDWPQFLGPSRNGISAGDSLTNVWPKNGPPVTWEKKVGQGFSGPVVSSQRLILFHRVEDKETIECLEARAGKSLWIYSYLTSYRDDFGFDEGPRATPAIAEGKVYTYGAEGVLTCLDFATGRKIWTVNAKTEFHAAKGFFGIACSPLIEGNAVLLIVGGRDAAGIVAFDRVNGNTLWKISNDEASYASPVACNIGGRRIAFFLTRSHLIAADPTNGKALFQFPFRPAISSSVSAATPLLADDMVFVSACYGAGALLLKIRGTEFQKVWESDQSLSAHYATPVRYQGFLYGINGRTDPGFEPPASLCCIELSTGKIRWEQPSFGAATIILAGEELLVLTERGELIRAPASPAGFKPTARAQILPAQVRAHPALADGLFYGRSKDKLVCVRIN